LRRGDHEMGGYWGRRLNQRRARKEEEGERAQIGDGRSVEARGLDVEVREYAEGVCIT